MIRIEELTKAYGLKVLLEKSTYHFPLGERIALVGANGVGKTTLLNIICGFEEADNGQVIKPKDCVLGYLPQEPNTKPKATVLLECIAGADYLQALKRELDIALQRMSENYSEENHAQFEKIENEFRKLGGYLLEGKAHEILTGLGFSVETLQQNPIHLSGGWRMRLELAKVFIKNPDFLLLDEPTNHLDLPSLVWVEKYLQSYAGTLLFVSHDRSLLNRMATITLHLTKGKLTPYKGNFDYFLEERARRAEEDAAKAEQLAKQKQAIVRFIERFGAKATKAAQAQSRMKMLSRIQDLETELTTEISEDAISFNLPEPPPCGKEVLSIDQGAIGYTKVLADKINFKIMRGQKIAIIGANGIGKSTLLKTIASKIKQLQGEFKLGYNVSLAYFAQDQLDTLNEEKNILHNVLERSSSLTEKVARGLLGSFLFRGDDVFKPIRVLSGGEKSRVGLACLLAEKANFLLLDEPTNHLDMSSVEALAQELDEYEGTVLFVSHDRTFIDEICTHVFVMLPDGRSALFGGKLEDYERLATVAGFPNVLNPQMEVILPEDGSTAVNNLDKNAPDKQSAEEDVIQAKRERQRIQKLLSKIEQELQNNTDTSKKLERELEQASGEDFQQVRKLHVSHKEVVQQISQLENDWLDASAKLEELEQKLKAMGRL